MNNLTFELTIVELHIHFVTDSPLLDPSSYSPQSSFTTEYPECDAVIDDSGITNDPYFTALYGTPRTAGSSDPKRTLESLGYVSKFGPLLFDHWPSNSITHDSEENIQTMYSHLQLFALERRDGELLESIRMISGPVYEGGLLHFLSYVINLLSNNLLSATTSDQIVQWFDHIEGRRLLASLLSLNSPTIKAFASNLLASALRAKDTSITCIILQAGASPNSPMGYSKDIPLQYVAEYGSTEVARILLNADADINAPPAGEIMRTALQAAAGNGNIKLVRILLGAGADVNALPACSGGRTALQAAAGGGNIKLVWILLDASADVNDLPAIKYGSTALQAAAEAGDGNIELV
jgi:hypothetical protein